MRKLCVVTALVVFVLAFVGCHEARTEYCFPSQGVAVSFATDEALGTKGEDNEPDSSVAVFDPTLTEYKGFISVIPLKRDVSIDELYEQYFGDEGAKKTSLGKESLFVDLTTTYSNGQQYDWYFFLRRDAKRQVMLFGRFSAHCNERERLIALFKSIRLREIPQESPYPEDYTVIRPDITIASSGEHVTDYCVVTDCWKEKEYTFASYEELLKEKKVYVLSEWDNIKFTDDAAYRAATQNAVASIAEQSLFHEGAAGYRIVKPASWGEDVFFVRILAKYGSSGELIFVFKCRFA